MTRSVRIGVLVAPKKWHKHAFARPRPSCVAYVDVLSVFLAARAADRDALPLVRSLRLDALLHKVGDFPPDMQKALGTLIAQIQREAPEIAVWDDPAHVDVLSSRWEMCLLLRTLCASTLSDPDTAVRLPHTTLFPDTGGHSFPAVVKPLAACGKAGSHDLAVVHAAAQISRSAAGAAVVQRFVPHGPVLYKVYVVGERVDVQLRPTLELDATAAFGSASVFGSAFPFGDTSALGSGCPPPCGKENESPNADQAVDSQTRLSDPEPYADECDPCVSLVDADATTGFDLPAPFTFSTSAMKKARVVSLRSPEGAAAMARLAPHMAAVRSFSARLRAALGGMALFGWDAILAADGLHVIDVNFFPGYDDAPFHEMLEAFALSRIGS